MEPSPPSLAGALVGGDQLESFRGFSQTVQDNSGLLPATTVRHFSLELVQAPRPTPELPKI